MKRLTPYLIAACVLLGVMAGPQKAHADGQIYACVNKSSGEIKLVAQNATCKNNELLVVWNVVGPAGPQGPAGVSAFTQFTASNGTTLCCGAATSFSSGISGGGGVGGSGVLSSFVLQPGVYQVQFFANLVTGCGAMSVLLDGSQLAQWVAGSFCGFNPVSTIGAAQLVAVSGPNQVLSFVVPAGNGSLGFDNGATLILTKLQ
jgi:hypothetical protein